MIEIRRNMDMIIDDKSVDFNVVNKKEFIIANLWNETKLQKGMNLEELIHFFYEIKDFVYQYFSEHYEVPRALITMGNFNSYYENMKFYKTLSIEKENPADEDEFVFISCNAELKPYVAGDGRHGTEKVCELPIVVDDFVLDESKVIGKKVKTKFYLMDFMSLIFEEVPNILKHDSVLI